MMMYTIKLRSMSFFSLWNVLYNDVTYRTFYRLQVQRGVASPEEYEYLNIPYVSFPSINITLVMLYQSSSARRPILRREEQRLQPYVRCKVTQLVPGSVLG